MRRISTAAVLLGSLILLSFAAPLASADDSGESQMLEQGDNILEYLKEHTKLHQHGSFRVSHWKEGGVGVYTDSPNSASDRARLILSLGRYPMAVLKGEGDDAHFLIDTNGDGILDVRRKSLFIPFWVVFENSPNKTADEKLIYVMELMYQAFQSEQGPSEHENMKQAFGLMNSYAADEQKENRDLFYMLYFYSGFSQKEKELSLLTMTVLRNQCQERLGKVHLLTYLFLAEALIGAEKEYDARQYIDRLLEQDPDFVPALVLRYRLEKDQEKGQQLLQELKAEHGGHWAVKDL